MIQDQTSALRRVYVRAPDAERDAIYVYDPVLMTDAGAILLRPGKARRRGEPDAVADDIVGAGVTVIGRLEAPRMRRGRGPALARRLDPARGPGVSARTTRASCSCARSWGPRSPWRRSTSRTSTDPTRACTSCRWSRRSTRTSRSAFLPLMPVRLLELLRRRGCTTVEVPEEELPTMGPNVLALGPRLAPALEGNAETRHRLEAAGVEVWTYAGDEISRNGDGGPTCLTRPLSRG